MTTATDPEITTPTTKLENPSWMGIIEKHMTDFDTSTIDPLRVDECLRALATQAPKIPLGDLLRVLSGSTGSFQDILAAVTRMSVADFVTKMSSAIMESPETATATAPKAKRGPKPKAVEAEAEPEPPKARGPKTTPKTKAAKPAKAVSSETGGRPKGPQAATLALITTIETTLAKAGTKGLVMADLTNATNASNTQVAGALKHCFDNGTVTKTGERASTRYFAA